MPLPYLSQLTKGRRELMAVEGLVQHKHVAFGSPGVRLVPLLHYHSCVPRVVVRKSNLEVGPI